MIPLDSVLFRRYFWRIHRKRLSLLFGNDPIYARARTRSTILVMADKCDGFSSGLQMSSRFRQSAQTNPFFVFNVSMKNSRCIITSEATEDETQEM